MAAEASGGSELERALHGSRFGIPDPPTHVIERNGREEEREGERDAAAGAAGAELAHDSELEQLRLPQQTWDVLLLRKAMELMSAISPEA